LKQTFFCFIQMNDIFSQEKYSSSLSKIIEELTSLENPSFKFHSEPGADPRGTISPLKTKKVALFTMILCNSENKISKTNRNKSVIMFELSHCSRYKPVLSSIVLSQQCYELYFIISLTVAKPL